MAMAMAFSSGRSLPQRMAMAMAFSSGRSFSSRPYFPPHYYWPAPLPLLSSYPWKVLVSKNVPKEVRRKMGSALPLHANAGSPPSSIDWRKKGAVTPVRDQGPHGTCWSFASTGSVESANKLVNGFLVELSTQEMVDCDYRNRGHCGGFTELSFWYIIENEGLCLASDYPYRGKRGICQKHKFEIRVGRVESYGLVPPGDEEQLKRVVASQPVVARIMISRHFNNYKGGLFRHRWIQRIGMKVQFHDVLIVGYGSKKGKDYWLIKNSWGERWGEKGYMRLERNTGVLDGLCGINQSCWYPIIANPKRKGKNGKRKN